MIGLPKEKVLFFHKSQEYLLYVLVFLLPLQTRWMIKLGELNGGYWEYGTYSLYGADLWIMGLFLFWFIGWLFFCRQMPNAKCQMPNQIPIINDKNSTHNTKYLILNTNVWWLAGVFELFVFISILAAPDKLLALYGYGRFLLGIGLFFLLTQIVYDKIKLYWSLVIAGAVQSVLAIQQFMTQVVVANKWLGMAAQQAKDLGVSVVEAGDERFLRAYGSLPHPNILGGLLAIVLLVNIILYFNLRREWRAVENTSQDQKYKIGLLLSLIIFILNFVGLLLTFSRSAWLGVAAGFIGLLVYYFINERKLFLISFKFVAIMAITAVLFVVLFPGLILGRLSIEGRLETKSIAERTAYNQEAWQIIKQHWLFGVGVRNYGLGVYNEINDNKPAYAYQPAHNVFLLIWAETGILGLVSFLVFLLSCFLTLWRRKNFEIMAVLVAIVVVMCFDHWVWSLAFGMYLFWFILGVSFKKESSII